VQCRVTAAGQQLQVHGRVGKDSHNRDSTHSAAFMLDTVPSHTKRTAGSP
jgi:hypothetical protein